MWDRFDPELVRADTDLVQLADRLAERGPGPVSFCLQGPPGTGKSAFVRYLAERMGLEVVQKRASDLMSKWVGDTEKRIAEAFAEARDAGSFLVFDEADSLLADRGFAVRSWEVSQVNEMLTWMESHPLPFACTTNFGEHLDPATLRRFVFKVTLDYLSPEQVEAAFRRFFAAPPPSGPRTARRSHPGRLRGGTPEGRCPRRARRAGTPGRDVADRARRKTEPSPGQSDSGRRGGEPIAGTATFRPQGFGAGCAWITLAPYRRPEGHRLRRTAPTKCKQEHRHYERPRTTP